MKSFFVALTRNPLSLIGSAIVTASAILIVTLFTLNLLGLQGGPYAGILAFATLGTIGANPSVVELGLLLAFGLLGYVLRRFHYPIAPVVVGLILGPLAEQQLRRALAISQGDPAVLFQTPVALVLYAIAAVAVLLPLWLRLRGKGRVLEQLAADED